MVAIAASSELIGAAVARIGGPDAHLLVFALHPSWRHLGIGSALLRGLDQEIIHRDSRRLVAIIRHGQVGEEAPDQTAAGVRQVSKTVKVREVDLQHEVALRRRPCASN